MDNKYVETSDKIFEWMDRHSIIMWISVGVAMLALVYFAGH